ncbi:MAG: DUF167 domain-containing protein [Thermoplasmata archaeon]|nr:DUF167 domain-containing protein [Thermoplasmata archaeon]
MARISLWVKPAAAADALAWDPWRDCWVVSCRAAPTRGEANRSVAILIAEWLGVPRSTVRWVRAGSSRAKALEVEGLTEVEAVRRLRAHAPSNSAPGPLARGEHRSHPRTGHS